MKTNTTTKRWRSLGFRLAAKTSMLLATLLLGACAAQAELVLEMQPNEYDAAALRWNFTRGSLAPEYFVSQNANPKKTLMPQAVSGYSAIDHRTGGGFSGPTLPAQLSGAGPRTIEAWIYRVGNRGTIFDLSRQYAPADGQFSFTAWDEWAVRDMATATQNDAGSAPYGIAIPDNQWVHVAVTYDGATLQPYVNGVAGTAKTYTYNTEAGGAMTIGISRGDGSYPPTPAAAHSFTYWDGWMAFQGYLGAIRVYDNAKSGAEITAEYGLGVNFGEVASPEYKIVASAGTGGSISPAGDVWVAPNANQAFDVTPNQYYDVTSVLVDGTTEALAGPDAQTYTFSNVSGNHTIAASFTAWVDTQITGTVTLDGVGQQGVRVTATGHRGPFTATTDAGGNYSIRVRPGDTYTLSANKVGFIPSPETLAAGPGDLTGKNFTLAVDPPRLQPMLISRGTGNWRNDTWTIGTRFTTGAKTVYVTKLGYVDRDLDGLNTTHEVGIWDAAGKLVTSVTVPALTSGELVGDFRYVPVNGLIALAPHTVYTVNAVTTGDDWPDTAPNPGFGNPDFGDFATGNGTDLNGAVAADQTGLLKAPVFSWGAVGNVGACCNLIGISAIPAGYYQVQGKVTLMDGTTPVTGATVTAAGLATFTGTSAADGTYTVVVAANDTYSVSATKAGYSISAPQTVPVATANVTGINFRISLINAVQGVVKTSTGVPIPNAIVQVGPPGTSYNPAYDLPPGPIAVSGPDGKYVVTGVDPNMLGATVDLYGDALGYADNTTTIDITSVGGGALTRDIVLTPKVETDFSYIQNGGFETGTLAGWVDGSNGTIEMGVTTDQAASGTHSGYWKAKAGIDWYQGYLTQDIPIIPGSTYNIYFKLKTTSATAQGQCGFNWITQGDWWGYDGAGNNWMYTPVPNVWEQTGNYRFWDNSMKLVAARVTPPPTATGIHLVLGLGTTTPGDTLYIDDVVVDRVGPAVPQNQNWTGATDSDWSKDSNWNYHSPRTGEKAEFSATGTSRASVNLTVPASVAGIVFNSVAPNTTIGSSTASALTLDNGNSATPITVAKQHVISAPLTLVNGINLSLGASTDALTLSGPISGVGALDRNTFGTLTLSGGDKRFTKGATAHLLLRGGKTIITSNVTLANDNGTSQFHMGGDGTELVIDNGGYLFANGGDWTGIGATDYTGGGNNTVPLTMTVKGNGKFQQGTAGNSSIVLANGGGYKVILNVQDSAQVIAPTISVGYQWGTGQEGTVNQTGGTMRIGLTPDEAMVINPANTTGSGGVTLGVGAGKGTGTYNFDGGVLVARRIRGSSGVSTFNFNGGTVHPMFTYTSAFMSGVTAANVKVGGAIFDCSDIGTPATGYDLTLSQNLQHDPAAGAPAVDGGLTKQGPGLLTLSGTNTYTGPTRVLAGVLSCTITNALAAGALEIAPGATVNLAYTGTRQIASLKIGATVMPSGVYGAVGSGAPNENAAFTGLGTVTIVSALPPTPTLPPGSLSIIGTVPTFSNVPTVSGYTYWLTYKNSLADNTWIRIGTGTAGGGYKTFTDTVTPYPASRFYRLEVQ